MLRATKNNDLMLVLIVTKKNPVLNIILANVMILIKK